MKLTFERLATVSASQIVFEIDWEAERVTCTHVEQLGRKRTEHALGCGSVSETWAVILEFQAMGYREVQRHQATHDAIVAGAADAKDKQCWRRAPVTFGQWRDLGYVPLLLAKYFEGFQAYVSDVAVQLRAPDTGQVNYRHANAGGAS